jgi:hypothetical protein
VQVDGATIPKRSAAHQRTQILCPRCGRLTGTALREGEAGAYCRFCHVEIDVIIRVKEALNSDCDSVGD